MTSSARSDPFDHHHPLPYLHVLPIFLPSQFSTSISAHLIPSHSLISPPLLTKKENSEVDKIVRNVRADFQCRLRQNVVSKPSPKEKVEKINAHLLPPTRRPVLYRTKAASTTAPAANTPPLTLDAAPVAWTGPLVVADGADDTVAAGALVAGTLAE